MKEIVEIIKMCIRSNEIKSQTIKKISKAQILFFEKSTKQISPNQTNQEIKEKQYKSPISGIKINPKNGANKVYNLEEIYKFCKRYRLIKLTKEIGNPLFITETEFILQYFPTKKKLQAQIHHW